MAERDRIPVVDYSRTSQPVYSHENNQIGYETPGNNQSNFNDPGNAGSVSSGNYARNSSSVYDNPRNVIPTAEAQDNLRTTSDQDYQGQSQNVYDNHPVTNTGSLQTALDQRFPESVLEYARAMAMYQTANANKNEEHVIDYARNDHHFFASNAGHNNQVSRPIESMEYPNNTPAVYSGDSQHRENYSDQVSDLARRTTVKVEGVPDYPASIARFNNLGSDQASVGDVQVSSAESMQGNEGHRPPNVSDTVDCEGRNRSNVYSSQTGAGNTKDSQPAISSAENGVVTNKSEPNVSNVPTGETNSKACVQKPPVISNNMSVVTRASSTEASLQNMPLCVEDTQDDTVHGVGVPPAEALPIDLGKSAEEEDTIPLPVVKPKTRTKRKRKNQSRRYPRKKKTVYVEFDENDDELTETEKAVDKDGEPDAGENIDVDKTAESVEQDSAQGKEGKDGKKGGKVKDRKKLPPLPNGRKKHSIPLWRKIEILNEFDKKPAGMSRKRLVGELGLKNRSTLSSILGSREKIVAEFLNSTNDKQRERRRMRSLKYDDIEEVITKWMDQCKVSKLPINGIVIQKKAERLARKLGHVEFKASNGWLDRFKSRNAVNLKEFSGKLADMSSAVDEPIYEWKELCLPVLIREYEASDIFVCSGGGTLFDLLPNEIAATHGDRCLKGENSNERITFCPCVNLDGSEKEALILIGNFSQKSAYSYGGYLESGAVHMDTDEKSWMTPESFFNYVLSLDSKMQLDDRHIILFTDEKYAKLEEKKNKELKNVSLKTIPLHFNPMNRGILKSIKSEYRYCQMKKMLSSLGDDMKGKMPKITSQDAAKMLETAWKELSSSTISLSFIDAGFEKKIVDHVDDSEPEDSKEEVLASVEGKKPKEKTADSRLHMFKKLKQYYKLPESLHFEDYLNADDDLVTCDEQIPEMPVEDLLPTMDIMLPEGQAELERVAPTPQVETLTPQDAVTSIGKVRQFLQMNNQWGNVPPAFFFSLDTIEQYVIDERMRSTFSSHLPSASSLTSSVISAANLASLSNMQQGVNLAGAGSPAPNPSTPNTSHAPQPHMVQNHGQGMGSMGHVPNNSGHSTPIPQNTGHTHMPSNFGHFHGNMGHHPFVGNVPIGHIPGNPSGHIAGNTGQWTAIYQNPNNFSPN